MGRNIRFQSHIIAPRMAKDLLKYKKKYIQEKFRKTLPMSAKKRRKPVGRLLEAQEKK